MCAIYEHEADDPKTGETVEVEIEYLFYPRRAAISDPERPEPEEPAIVEIQQLTPEGIITEEEAEDIIWGLLAEPY